MDEANVNLLLQIAKANQTKLDQVLADMKDIKEELKCVKGDINGAKSDIVELKQQNLEKDALITNLYKKVDQLENQSRRNNIIIKGIPERYKESWNDCIETTVKIAKDLGVNIRKIDVERAHRIKSDKTPRPIISKLVYYQDKADIIDNRRLLKTKRPEVKIEEDFSHAIREERKILLEEMYKHRQENKYATISYNKLQIEDKIFQYDRTKKALIKIGEKNKPEKLQKKRKRDFRQETESPKQEAKKAGSEQNKNADITEQTVLNTQTNNEGRKLESPSDFRNKGQTKLPLMKKMDTAENSTAKPNNSSSTVSNKTRNQNETDDYNNETTTEADASRPEDTNLHTKPECEPNKAKNE